ncbi:MULTISPECIES: hypothetical protein [Isoptericola]|uniref:Uncharacterized protein n=1 Tax=Isoptericola sediminis TaxID=2733572 RepID=A0A849K6F2_9MICO|nr:MULTISPECIES: hypothetical protein [Isoptericola]MDO8145856.1 hypothetical protein [Isoptericola sp. 178]MDO8149931.1 hypothetical protein [Isoptericola sp. b408]NNU26747.1 hypothetical protein [Isoptericola sediminis]
MCYPATCSTCGKTTWSGCGQHVADVRRSVPASQWCDGHADAPRGGGSFFSRLFNR